MINLVDWWCCSVQLCPFWLSACWISQVLIGIEISNYYCKFINFSLQFYKIFPHIFWCLIVRCIHTEDFYVFSESVQSLSCVWLFVAPWTAACQASLSITNLQSLVKLMSIELVMPSNHLIICHPLFFLPSNFPASGSFPTSQFAASGSQSIGASASASVLPMNIQDWLPLGWTGWISWLSKGLSRVCSNTTAQKHQFFGTQLSL